MKKFMTFVLVTLMSLTCLAGCGSDKPQTDNSTAKIKIGASGPLTGGAAIYGNAVKNGAEIAVEEVNAKGGLQFELNFQDDEADGEKAAAAYGVLKDWGMQVSMFTVTSGAGAAVAANYSDDNIFALTPSGSSTDLVYTDAGRYKTTFQMCFTDPNQGVGSADYIAENMAAAKVGVIYKNDDVYSTGVYEKFMAEAKVKGLDVVYTGSFDESTSTDFSTQLGQCQAANADLVFLPIYYTPASSILMQASAANYTPTFFGVDGMDGILTMKNFDTKYAEGVYLLTPFAADSQDEITKNFVSKYEDKFGETPNQFAADAYDVIYAIASACEATGCTADMSASDIADKLVTYFTTDFSFNGCTGSNITWGTNGEVSKLPKAVVIKDGVYVSAN